MLLESKIESAYVNKLRRWAVEVGVKMYIWKLSAPGIRGVPDRIILWEGGNVLFVEFKVPGKVETKLQALVHEILRQLGFTVEVHDDSELALESTKARVLSSLATNTRYEDDGTRGRQSELFKARTGKNSSGLESLPSTQEARDGRLSSGSSPPSRGYD